MATYELTDKKSIIDRIHDFLAENGRTTRHIHSIHTKALYKHGLDTKKLKDMVDDTVRKLNQILASTEEEFKAALDQHNADFKRQEQACTNRDNLLRAMLHQIESGSTTADLNFVSTAFKKIELELKFAKEHLSSLGTFEMSISPEMSNLCRSIMQLENPIHIRMSSLQPKHVELLLMRSSGPCKAISTMVVPLNRVARLRDLLTTVQLDAGDKMCIQGIISNVTNENGSIGVTFAPLPPPGEYVIKVLMCGQHVRNSPLKIRVDPDHTVHPISEMTMYISSIVKEKVEASRSQLPSSNAISNGSVGTNHVEPRRRLIATHTTALSVLASRARHNSGANPQEQQQPVPSRMRHKSGPAVGVVVAPKLRVINSH